MNAYLENQKNIPSILPCPARLCVENVARILGFTAHDLSVLMSQGLLKPLGNPAQNGPKFFAAVKIYELALDAEWLDKAARAITKYWKKKNKRDKENESPAS
jgi:hypothetical protein